MAEAARRETPTAVTPDPRPTGGSTLVAEPYLDAGPPDELSEEFGRTQLTALPEAVGLPTTAPVPDSSAGIGAPTLIAAARLAVLAASAALFALLCWVLVAASAAVLVARRRHRVLLSLLAHGDPKVPGALVVDHPAAAAYCVPGTLEQGAQ